MTYSNRTKGYGFKYWEIGNENYGGWENDTHVLKNDALTYANQAKEYLTKMKAVDTSIKVGVVVVNGEDQYPQPNSAYNPRTKVTHTGWTPVLLSRLKTLGVMPDFVIYHRYELGPYAENDATLLQSRENLEERRSRSAPTTDGLLRNRRLENRDRLHGRTTRSTPLRASSRRASSMVSSLRIASEICFRRRSTLSYGGIFETEGTSRGTTTLRAFTDGGSTGTTASATETISTPPSTRGKALSKFTGGGDRVVKATSDYSLLSIYAVNRTNGGLSLLVINKSPTLTLNSSIALTGYTPVSTGGACAIRDPAG